MRYAYGPIPEVPVIVAGAVLMYVMVVVVVYSLCVMAGREDG